MFVKAEEMRGRVKEAEVIRCSNRVLHSST